MSRRAAFPLVLAAGLLAGCERKMVVGVVLPETGSAAVYGASIKSGFRLALESSAQPGATDAADFEFRDSGSDPGRAVAAAESLIDAGATLVIGGVTTAEAKAMIALADRRETVLISPSASAPELSRKSTFFFRLYPSDEFEGVEAADFLTGRQQARSVMIVQEDNDYTRGLVPVFVGELTSRGGQVVATVRVGEAGWEGEIRRGLSVRHPDAVYLCGYGDAILSALRVLRGTRYAGTVCTTSAINTSELIRRAGALGEELFFPLVSIDDEATAEPGKSFVRRYREAYNLTPDIYAACGYDAALLALAVVRSGARSGPEVRHFLHTLPPLRGVTGELVFDELGNIRHTPRIHRLHDGVVEPLGAASKRGQVPGGASRPVPPTPSEGAGR